MYVQTIVFHGLCNGKEKIVVEVTVESMVSERETHGSSMLISNTLMCLVKFNCLPDLQNSSIQSNAFWKFESDRESGGSHAATDA